MKEISREELKRIRLYRQHITNKADTVSVAKDLCGLQAQFLSNALHSLKIRCYDYDGKHIEKALAKNWTVRGTVHIFAKEDLPLFINCNGGEDYRKNEWSGYRFWNKRDCWALTPERQQYFSSLILSALKDGAKTRDELKDICRANGMTEGEEGSLFNPWGGGIRELCERGFLNYTVKEKKEFCLSPEFVPMKKEEAELEICRRYLTNMAPATVEDICYYLKCTKREARERISLLSAKRVSVEGVEHFYLGDIEGDHPDIPTVVFLAGFDQLMLAYEKKTNIFLPAEHMRRIFNLAGIVMPSLLIDGTVCGRWKKTKKQA